MPDFNYHQSFDRYVRQYMKDHELELSEIQLVETQKENGDRLITLQSIYREEDKNLSHA